MAPTASLRALRAGGGGRLPRAPRASGPRRGWRPRPCARRPRRAAAAPCAKASSSVRLRAAISCSRRARPLALLVAAPRARRRCAPASRAQRGLVLLQLLEQRLRLRLLVVEARARVRHRRRGQAQPLRHLQGQAAAGHAQSQPVGRLVGRRGRTRTTRRRTPGVDCAYAFMQAVVRGGHHHRAARAEVVDDGHAERAALGGIGARADLVEQHQRRRREVARHLHDVGQVRGEGGQVGRDRLLVADVGVDRAGRRAATLPARGGDVQAALRHERQQADGLEGDRLPAGVGAADDEHRRAAADRAA